jgi:hypothetical protein
MAKVKLNTAGLTDLQLIQLGTDMKTALTGNPNFTTPVPTLIAGGTILTTAQTKLTASDTLQAAAQQGTTDKNVSIDAVRALLTQWGNYIELTANGDESKIQSAGVQVRATRAPVGIPDQVQNLGVTAGDNEGELDPNWDSVANAKTYEMQSSPDPITGTSWVAKGSVTKSKGTLTGLTSGAKMWVRVRAIGTAGPGAWSDPATKVVP